MSNITQELTLPSQGLLNPEIPEGKVVQRCMMVQDQKYLAGSDQSAGSSIHQMIQRTITSPENFDVSRLTLPDTLYLLFKLRILSYGEEYSFKARCPECGKKIPVSINLADLPFDVLEEGYEEKLVGTLPHTGDKVYTRILRNSDLDDIAKEVKRRKKRDSNDQSDYIIRLAQSIEKIELIGEDKKILTHPFEIERYIESLTDLDAATILSIRDSVVYGLYPTVEYVCPECRNYIDVSVQFSGEFFRPNISR